ncbi:hypothetical protein GIB67_021658, partial [Kingdonia uniflora]
CFPSPEYLLSYHCVPWEPIIDSVTWDCNFITSLKQLSELQQWRSSYRRSTTSKMRWKDSVHNERETGVYNGVKGVNVVMGHC